VGIIISINVLSWKKRPDFKSRKKARKVLLPIFIVKVIIGIFITTYPLFFTNSLAKNYIEKKLESDTNIEIAKIYDLIYPTKGHLSGTIGYEYEFYLNGKKYKGRGFKRNRKIGESVAIKYNIENPWLNKRNE
jgi:hypothetical protein